MNKANKLPEPPRPPRRPQTRTLHGETVVDDYAWMHDRDDPNVLAYLEAENAYTQARLAHTEELRDTIYKEMRSRVQETDRSVPVDKNGWWYYVRTQEGSQYRRYCRSRIHPDEAGSTEVVILDEPSSGLDVGSTLVLKKLIRALADAGKIVLYSSHILELVEQICSSVVILRDGAVVASDRVERLRELMEQPSLEQVFTQLAVQEDVDQVAKDLVEAMAL